jgi:hypothetical protein
VTTDIHIVSEWSFSQCLLTHLAVQCFVPLKSLLNLTFIQIKFQDSSMSVLLGTVFEYFDFLLPVSILLTLHTHTIACEVIGMPN